MAPSNQQQPTGWLWRRELPVKAFNIFQVTPGSQVYLAVPSEQAVGQGGPQSAKVNTAGMFLQSLE
tara:strand:+ start:88 stop:285 length:198 start_codon:yes stop_codon:yes gene_type:complete